MSRAARALALALAAAWMLLAAPQAEAAPKFPALNGRVVDQAQVLSPQAEAELTQELAALETSTGRQLVVATVPDLQGYPIEDYGYQLGRAWGVGDKDRDDGVVLLVALKERQVRVEVGYGLEPVLTDALSNVILQERVLPQFREGRLEAGVLAGARAIVQQLSLPDDQAKAAVARAAAAPQPQQGQGVSIPTIVVVFLVFWLISSLMRGFGGRGGRRSAWWLLPMLMSGGGRGGGGGFGGGGFSGGGGSFGGGGASGRW